MVVNPRYARVPEKKCSCPKSPSQSGRSWDVTPLTTSAMSFLAVVLPLSFLHCLGQPWASTISFSQRPL